MKQRRLIKGQQGPGGLSPGMEARERTRKNRAWSQPTLPATSLTSADPLLFPGEDPWRVDDADALQHGVGQLGTHEPAWVTGNT